MFAYVFILIIVLMFLLDLLWWRQADRMLRRLRAAAFSRSALSVFMVAQIGCFGWIVIGRILGHDRRPSGYSIFVASTYLWHMIVVLPSVIAFAGAAMISKFGKWIGGRRQISPSLDIPGEGRGGGGLLSDVDQRSPLPNSPPEYRGRGQARDPSSMISTRRAFLSAAAVAAPPLATVCLTGVSAAQRNHFRVRPLDIVLPNLPRDLEGVRIAHVTDIHIGSFTNGQLLTKVVEATNALKSDLVLLTGDLINMSLSDLPAGLDMVRRMDARAGFYMCEGNHDLFEDPLAFDQRTRSAGVPLLVNDSALLRLRGVDVQLLGLQWGGTTRDPLQRAHQRGEEAINASMAELVPKIQPGAFPILMAHHPHAFDAAARANIPLTLSGHTHGGQINLTRHFGFGPAMYRYWSGLYQKNERQNQLVVSNGVGNWFPLRVNAPAEIVSITLHRA